MEDVDVRQAVNDDDFARAIGHKTGPPLQLRPPPGRRVPVDDE
jgi:hypothetical protein